MTQELEYPDDALVEAEEAARWYAQRSPTAAADSHLRGRVQTIAGLVGRDVPWSIIEAATGIDEAAFHRLKHQLDAADGGAAHSN